MEGIVDIEKQRRPDSGIPKDIKKADILGLVHSHGQNSKPVQTTRNLSICLWLVFEYLNNNEMIEFIEFYRKKMKTMSLDSNKKLQMTLEKVGWINGKKLSRLEGSKQDQKELNYHFEKNHEILQKQIVSMAPDLILVFNGDFYNNVEKLNLPYIRMNILKLNHPRTWNSYKSIYENTEIICKYIMNN